MIKSKKSGFQFLLIFFSFSTLLLGGSCQTTKKLKNITYLSDIDSSTLADVHVDEVTIEPGDRLSIIVSALNPASAISFNLTDATTSTVTLPTTRSYLVGKNGTIQFPQLGELKVGGLTISQIKDQITNLLAKYLKEPAVTVQLINFKVTILGEVNRPGTVTIPDAEVDLLEGIGLAGDLTIFGRRDNILIIRKNGAKREKGRINLLKNDSFKSPFFHLKQNDVIYVEMTPNKVASVDQITIRNVSIIASIATVLTSLLVLIINLVK